MEQKPKYLKVTYYHRRPFGSFYSLERLFAAIRIKIPDNIICKVGSIAIC